MSRIALALIKQLVANGQLDADDVAAMCKELSERDSHNIKAAWIEGLVGDDNKDFAPTLRVIDGGQSANIDANQD
jgi:hypothetical protein